MRRRLNTEKLGKNVKVGKAWNDLMGKTKTHVGLWCQKKKKKKKKDKKKEEEM